MPDDAEPRFAVDTSVAEMLADRGVAGGAAYDAFVALAARDNNRVLVTRDARARPTYAAVGVKIVVI